MVTVGMQTIPGSQGYRVTRKGYLIVWGAKHKTIATFAPGSWGVVQCLGQQEQ